MLRTKSGRPAVIVARVSPVASSAPPPPDDLPQRYRPPRAASRHERLRKAGALAVGFLLPLAIYGFARLIG